MTSPSMPCPRQNAAGIHIRASGLWGSDSLRRLAFTLFATVLADVSPAVTQEAFAPDLCVMAVENATIEVARSLVPRGVEIPRQLSVSSALARDAIMLPGVPKPILYPWFAGRSAWTVSGDNRFEALQGPFPSSSLLDEFAVETATGRVLGARSNGVYAFEPERGQFRLLVPALRGGRRGEIESDTDFRSVHGITHVARLGMTLIGTENGVFQLAGEDVQPLTGAGKREVGVVYKIIDLPVHRAVILVGRHRALLRHDGGTVESLADLSGGLFSSDDYVVRAWESRQPGRILLRGQKRLLEIEMRQSQRGFSPGHSSALASSSSNITLNDLATRSGDYLLLGRSPWSGQGRIRRMEADGFHAVVGEGIEWPRSGGVRMQDVTTRGLVLISGGDRLYAYDGSRVSALPGTEPDRIGQFPRVHEMPSIGMVILQTDRGLFELTATHQVEPLRLPFPRGEDGYLSLALSELPAAHIGLIATRTNLYAMTPDGVVRPIRGGAADRYGFTTFAGVIPGRNLMLVRGRNSLHLIGRSLPSPNCNAPPD